MDEVIVPHDVDFEAVSPDIEALRTSPARFVNREVSWLQFNMRVLEEAANTNHPLLERLRFVSISANNLDEFFMVRVAGLMGQIRAGLPRESADGMTPAEQIEEIAQLAQHLHLEQQDQWQEIRTELLDHNIILHDGKDLSPKQLEYLQRTFRDEIFPVLTPIAIDPAHPFPFIPNLGLSLAFQLERSSDTMRLNALVRIPPNIDRFVKIPTRELSDRRVELITVDTLVRLFVGAFSQAIRLLVLVLSVLCVTAKLKLMTKRLIWSLNLNQRYASAVVGRLFG